MAVTEQPAAAAMGEATRPGDDPPAGEGLDDSPIAGLPAIDGEADAHYLSAALARAGRPRRVGRLDTDRLDGGRISANVFSLRSDAGGFVLKKFTPEPWRVELFGSAFNEPALWSCGVTRDLPEPLCCPTIDVAFHRARRVLDADG